MKLSIANRLYLGFALVVSIDVAGIILATAMPTTSAKPRYSRLAIESFI